MPVAAFAPLIAGGIGSLLGGISGAANPRPPSLSGPQSAALNALLGPNSNLLSTAMGNPTIDPVQQANMFAQNAQSLTGANNAVTHALTSRGLGRSGLLGAGLIQNQNQSAANQGNINLGLQQQAVQQKQLSIQDLLGLLNVNNTPGQSGLGAFMAGMAPVAAYSIQNQLNKSYGQNSGVPNATLGDLTSMGAASPLPTFGS
jgi:hypothetical protein